MSKMVSSAVASDRTSGVGYDGPRRFAVDVLVESHRIVGDDADALGQSFDDLSRETFRMTRKDRVGSCRALDQRVA
jgi:hypothetical protein